jgi:hypothetical protein
VQALNPAAAAAMTKEVIARPLRLGQDDIVTELRKPPDPRIALRYR